MFSVPKIVLNMNLDYLSNYMMPYQKYVWYLNCSLSSHFTSMDVSQKSSCSKHYIIGLGYYVSLVYQFNKISNQWDHIWDIKTRLTSPLLLKCLYQARKMTGHVVVVIIDSASFYDFDIGSRNCSDRVVFCLFFILFDKQIQLFFLNSKQTIYKFKIMFVKKIWYMQADTH